MKFNARCKDEPIDDEVLPRGGTEQVRREHKQGVEPTSGLVYTLRYKVSGERVFEPLLVFEWVVELCIGHAGEHSSVQ